MELNLIEKSFIGLEQFVILMTLAGLFGLLLGIERIAVHKTTGMRTYALVTLSSAFFVLIGRTASHMIIMDNNAIILQFAAAIITGVGFLGAGLILHKNDQVQNVTTAAGLWMCAAIGMATGFGLIWYATLATFMTFITLHVLSSLERYMKKNIFHELPEGTCNNCGSCDVCSAIDTKKYIQ
jgi:putative Mg2+ transporter-C (MgtC) family protein